MFDLFHPAFAIHRSYWEWKMHHWQKTKWPLNGWSGAIAYGLRPEFAEEFFSYHG